MCITSGQRQPEADLISTFDQPPILVSLGKAHRALVIEQKSGVAFGLDPDAEGKILWQTRVGKGGVLGGIEWGSAADGQNMYAAVSDLALKATEDSSSPTGSRYVPNPDVGGGLFALDLATGEKRWAAMPASCGKRPQCSPRAIRSGYGDLGSSVFRL